MTNYLIRPEGGESPDYGFCLGGVRDKAEANQLGGIKSGDPLVTDIGAFTKHDRTSVCLDPLQMP